LPGSQNLRQASLQRYRQHCAEEPSIPVFARDWWLDAVCAGDWDAVLVEKNGRVEASMPVFLRRRGPFRYLVHPPLTPVLGPWIRPTEAKYTKRLAQEKRLMAALIEELPDYDYFFQKWHRSIDNWLPFYWRGFEQTTMYTHVIDDLGDVDALWQRVDSRIRGDIRKARNRNGLTVRDSDDLDAFIDINETVFLRQGRALPYSHDVLRRLDAACSQRAARKIWIAADDEERIHAAIYVVWDESCAYYLMGGAAPVSRTTGASSLLIWEAIRHAATVTRSFDFEGSMVESIEHFFRGFGGRQTPYFAVSHTKSRLVRASHCLKSLVIGR